MTHTRTQLVMSLVSGLMLGVAFYHMAPHSIALVGGARSADVTMWWLMAGLIGMLLLLRLFHFHRHDFSRDTGPHCEHGRDHLDHGHVDVSRASGLGVALGLAVHTVIDGVALGAVMMGSSGEGSHNGLLGGGVFLAILLHKPLDAMAIIMLMSIAGWSRAARRVVNIGFAALCPLAALAFYSGVSVDPAERDYIVGLALAFTAGAFICIALSDLLPEVQFHSHDRLKLTLAFIVGIVLAYSIGALEPGEAHGITADHGHVSAVLTEGGVRDG